MTRKLFFGMIAVLIALTACSSGAAPAAPPSSGQPNPVSNAPAATQAPPTATPAVPADIPIMSGATDMNVNESQLSYIVKNTLQEVMDFYGKQMIAQGWKEQEPASILGAFGRMYYAKPDHQASFMLTYSEANNQVIVRINMITLNVFSGTPTP